MNKIIVRFILILIAIAMQQAVQAKSKYDLLKVPSGFKIEVFANNVPNARTMVLGENGTLFVAEQGSWNRSKKLDYKVMMATISVSGGDEKVTKYEPLFTDWLQVQKEWGRPI